MCGICGVVDLRGGAVSAGELTPMTAAMRLRGPDDDGLWLGGPAGLGHRRLSVIDLGGGHQPMGNEDGQIQTVLNGEIYNFVALRERLTALGHHFRTRSDTEVIVHGYEQWGDQVVEHLDGMFALALWDARDRRLLLARDRFGKKPLCWFHREGRFVFASTQTALLTHPLAPRQLDQAELARYLALEFVPAPGAILAGVRKLEAGTVLTLDSAGRVAERRYFQLDVRAAPRSLRGPAAEEALRELLVAAVKRRLQADVPVGIFLSGGVDSSAVTWAASELGAGRIKTFSIGFADSSFDESDHARLVARHFGTEHIEDQVSAGSLLEVVPHLGEILDEPMADASIVPTYCLSRLARRHVTVALGGDGGDELLAGYPTYQAHQLAGLLRPLLRKPLLELSAGLLRRLPVSHKNLSLDFKLKKTLEGLGYPESVRNYVWLGAFRPDELGGLLSAAPPPGALLEPVERAYREAPGQTHLERVLYQDVRLYLCHEILMKVDRASMAHSLEVRAPFLDTALARLLAALPLSEKRSLLHGKLVLKRALRGRLPAGILSRPKKGFGVPIGKWLLGPLKDLAHDLLLDRAGLVGSGLFQRAALVRLLSEHARGEADHRKRLWTLMVLSLWRDKHLSRPPPYA